MATRNLTREITVEEISWGNIYTGPREALVAAGLVDPSKFPGDPGNNKTSLRYSTPEGLERRVRLAKGGCYVVWAIDPPEVRCAKMEAARLEDARKAAIAKVAAMPKNTQEFRERLRYSAQQFMFAFTGIANTGFGGYRVDPEAMYEIRVAALKLMEMLDEVAIVFSPEARDNERALILEHTLGEDPGFTRFLERATTAPSDPGEPE